KPTVRQRDFSLLQDAARQIRREGAVAAFLGLTFDAQIARLPSGRRTGREVLVLRWPATFFFTRFGERRGLVDDRFPVRRALLGHPDRADPGLACAAAADFRVCGEDLATVLLDGRDELVSTTVRKAGFGGRVGAKARVWAIGSA